MKKIVILTTGQPSTNPRMMKEVNALLSKGYVVKVFYSYWISWAKCVEKELIMNYPPGTFIETGGNPFTQKRAYNISRVTYKMVRIMARSFRWTYDYAVSRNSFSLELAARREKADLYIAHNLGALPAACKAAVKWKAACGFDAEDYHRGEFERPEGLDYAITKSTEDKYLSDCHYLTAASPLIAKAYEKIIPGKKIETINNVFSRTYRQSKPSQTLNDGLSICWFSQSVGPARGLEMVIQAINSLPGYAISFHILGHCSPEYKDVLTKASVQPGLLHFLDPVPEADIFRIVAQFDIGLASELPHCENRDICLTNKLFTYLLAGNAILASDTRAQKDFLSTYPGIGLMYRNGDAGDLAEKLRIFYQDKAFLSACRIKAWELSDENLNWETESRKFLSIIDSILR